MFFPSFFPMLLAVSPHAAFTTTASLRMAVEAYNADSAAAAATYGPIADWDVSGVTDMRKVCHKLELFNVDISSWDTSNVTTMQGMFAVIHAFALGRTSPH